MQLHQQPSALQGCSRLGSPCPLPRPGLEAQPLWGCSQHGQREPRPGGSPHCFLKLSPGQRVARAKASLSERCTQPFPGELSCPPPGSSMGGWAAGGGWACGEMGGREEVGLTQQGGNEVRHKQRLIGSSAVGTWGPAGCLESWRWRVAVTSLGKRAPERSGLGRAAGRLTPGVWHRGQRAQSPPHPALGHVVPGGSLWILLSSFPRPLFCLAVAKTEVEEVAPRPSRAQGRARRGVPVLPPPPAVSSPDGALLEPVLRLRASGWIMTFCFAQVFK